MAQRNNPSQVANKKQNRRRVGTIAGLLLMSASLAASGCDLPDDGSMTDGVADPGFNPGADAGATVIPNATVILDREDLLAVAPAGVTVTPQVIRDIEDQFQPKAERSLSGKVQVMYLGPIDFNFSRSEGFRSGVAKVEHLEAYTELQRSLPGHRVMWANMESENLYVINYPQPAWADQEIEAAQDFDPAPAPGDQELVGPDFDHDWFRSSQYRSDARGVLVGKDTRHRVFEEDEPVQGKFFKRLLSLGGGTGAMIGRRHFLTAAHVVVDYNKQDKEIEIVDVTIRAGRNGNSQIGKSASTSHVWWMADWTPKVSGTERRGFDMAWGVMDRPLGNETGYFGLMSASSQEIESEALTIRNAGYSSCTPGNDPIPPNCLRRHIFLDSNNCDIIREDEPDSMGWGRAVAHGCDTNRGHSGSPLVVTKNGSLYVWAIHSGTANHINYASRLTRNRHRNLMTEMFDRYPRDE